MGEETQVVLRVTSAALVSTLLLLGLRLDLARVVSLGDSEALFLAYGLHPQPAYLNHPGLIGWFSEMLGPGVSPRLLHVGTAFAASLLPWVGVWAARGCGAPWQRALYAYFPLALIPELSVASFAFGPHLLFCLAWLAALGCGGIALRHPPHAFTTLLAWLAAGVACAASALALTSGWALAASLLVAVIVRPDFQRLRTLGPWAAFGLFAILVSPLFAWWSEEGLEIMWDFTPSGGQLLLTGLRPLASVTPPFLFAGALVARDLFEKRGDAVDRWLLVSLLLPLAPQLLLAAFATPALGEFSWLMPALLTLSVQCTRAERLGPRLTRLCLGLGGTVVLASWAWLRTDLPFVAGQMLGGYTPAQDASNDLHAWGPARTLLVKAASAAYERTGHMPVVVGPHWAVCAQAEIALGGRAHVGCDTAQLDDYDRWSSPELWSRAPILLFVTDSRFHEQPPESFEGHALIGVHRTTLERFGRDVRQISVSEFEREETALLER